MTKRGHQEYWFEIWQDGTVVAEGSGPVRFDVGREMVRYALQYIQDGPITIKSSPELRDGADGEKARDE